MKKKEKQPLVLIYYKLKDGIPLTEEEQHKWNVYRNKYPSPTGKTIDPEDLNRIVQWPQPTASPGNTNQQQQRFVGKLRRLPVFLYKAVAACLLTAIVTWYFFANKPAHTTAAIPRWDTLTTRNGQQAALKLPDGSEVYLNAASKLRNPVAFTAAERVVELLEGEAWLQVVKDTVRPFVVHCQGQQVKVLGTQFNIKARRHSADAAIITTLLEGAIQITYNNQKAILKPGRSCVNRHGQLSIVYDSLSDITAWRNSLFTFHDKRLSTIMDEVERWYDVEVIYVDPLQDVPFTIIDRPRKAPLEDLLNDLEASRLVRFRMEGRKVYISK